MRWWPGLRAATRGASSRTPSAAAEGDPHKVGSSKEAAFETTNGTPYVAIPNVAGSINTGRRNPAAPARAARSIGHRRADVSIQARCRRLGIAGETSGRPGSFSGVRPRWDRTHLPGRPNGEPLRLPRPGVGVADVAGARFVAPMRSAAAGRGFLRFRRRPDRERSPRG